MRWYAGIEVAKDPDDVINWRWDWGDDDSPWLGDGDSIADHLVEADSGITIESSNISGDGVNVVLSGGTAGESYDVTVRITTSGGLVDDRTVIFVISEK